MVALLTSEFRKVTTLRFWWALLIAPLTVGLFASAIIAGIANQSADLDLDEAVAGAAFIGLFIAVVLAILFAAIFGALNAGTEFTHKTITPTFLTASGRDGVIGAKLLISAAFGLLYGLVVEIVSVGVILIFGQGDIEFDGLLFKVLAAGLFVVVAWSIIGAGLGLLFGSSLAAVLVVVIGPIADLIIGLILFGFGLDSARSYMPFGVTTSTLAVGELDSDDAGIAPWPVPLLMVLFYVVVIAGAGWLVARRRDVT
ncbi:ABC transporter permease [Antrihabitans spumae]|uniref:ABC transporter permease n=1 Tax=Antrihabitans spumae TaxID=3373370 RepID=A0ABW7JWH0_9NOCA